MSNKQYSCYYDACNKTYTIKNSLTKHYQSNPEHKPEYWPVCHSCSERFDHISEHWRRSSMCDYPEITEYQHNILTGILMGDGSVGRYNRKPHIQITGFTTPEYLIQLQKIFGVMSTGVQEDKTAEESAEENRISGFRQNADPNNYSDTYRWKTRTHPNFKEFEKWYSTGKKVWPEDITLEPETLTAWYVCDGTLHNEGAHCNISISMSNERFNKKKIIDYFKNMNLPTPSRFQESTENNIPRCSVCWTKPDSIELLKYMGSPPPGFEYKWPDDNKPEN